MSPTTLFRTTALAALICLPLAGCSPQPAADGGGAPSTPGGTAPAATGGRDTSGGATFNTAALSVKPGAELPGVQDEGRLNLSAPKGWDWFPRDAKYVTRFFKTSQGALPRILVTVAAAPSELPTDITADNVDELREYIAAELVVEDIKPLEPPKAIQVNDTALVRFVRGGKLKNASVERQMLSVVRGGRLYTIELQSFPAETETYRDAAYAVAGSMKFNNKE